MKSFTFFRRRAARSRQQQVGSCRARLCVEELEGRLLPSSSLPPSLTQTYSLVTLSGQSASLLMGGEQPVAEPDGHGGKMVVFEPFGTQFQFLPTVLQDGSINLQVNVGQSAFGQSGSALGVNTTINLQDGQTLMLAQDQSTPFQVAVTPHILAGSTPMVDLTVTETAPRALITSLPGAVRPSTPQQRSVSDTYTLTALSGQTATLLLGGEQPLPGTGGNTELFGAQLNIVPTIEGNGSILLNVQANETALSTAYGSHILGTFVPGQVALDVQTSVQAMAGQTIALNSVQGLPFLITVMPQVVLGGGAKEVAVTVKVVEPSALAAAWPQAVRPTPSGQKAVTNTYTLTASNGNPATLFLGGQTPGLGGTLERSGVELNVTPTLLDSGKVQLDVTANESALNQMTGSRKAVSSVVGQLALNLSTAVELQDQETLALGGDQGLPVLVLITPQLVAGTDLVNLTVKFSEPAAMAVAQAASLQPPPKGQKPVTRTLDLTTLSGTPASLTLGGTQLNLVPTVLNSGAIMLNIEVRQGGSSRRGIFRDLETAVDLQAGQTLALGGDAALPFEVQVTPNLVGTNMVSVAVTIVY